MTIGDVGVAVTEHMFVECRMMGIPDHELTALIRSAAIAPPASKVGVEREQLIEALEELLQQRSLLCRLGDDLRTVARANPAAVRR
jgi:hypothetical protein